MADFNKPATTDTYTNVLAYIKATISDLALHLDPATTSPTNVPTNAVRWNSANNQFEKYNGTTWAALSTTWAFTNISASGTLSVGGATTFSGGVANGIGYLNGSKVLTTGAALTFDGTDFATTGKASATAFVPTGSTVPTNGMYLPASNVLAWARASGEAMRLDGTGLGIGTSSPSYKLDVNGTFGVSGNVTLSGGTANGVLYLNGSKVATSGSALTFDGTNFATTGTITSSNANASIKADGGTAGIRIYANSGGVALLETTTASDLIFRINSTEQMRLTSTGLGIGTSSPSGKLDVDTASNTYLNVYTSNTNSAAVQTFISGATSDGAAIGYNVALRFGTATNKNAASFSEKARFDSSGNLGLGVTPSAWNAGYKAFEINSVGNGISAQAGAGAQLNVSNNAYWVSGWKYGVTDLATLYAQQGGKHIWSTAASGTAGNAISFTQAMTLDASKNLLVGDTTNSASARVLVAGGNLAVGSNGTSPEFQISYDGTSAYLDARLSNGAIIFRTYGSAEKLRIEQGGTVQVGATSMDGSGRLRVKSWTPGTANGYAISTHDTVNYYAMQFVYGTGQVGTIAVTSSSTTYNTSSDYRLKNIEGEVSEEDSGAFIDGVIPYFGTWRVDGSPFVGFLAHQAQSFARTRIATGEKDGKEMQSMDYSSAEIIANLTAQVKFLRKRVAAVEATIH